MGAFVPLIFYPKWNFKKNNMEIVNNLSQQLKKIVDAARPKKGQVIYFASLRPNAGGSSVRNTDRIFDPWGGDTGKGEYIDIGYITGQVPAKRERPAQYTLGRIQFTKSAFNIMGISGDNRGQDDLFQYLFLTNYNKTNIGKDWYAPGDGQMPIFEMQEPAKTAKEKNDFRRKVRMAGEKIDVMPDSKLVDYALALDMRGINEFSKMDEIRDKLYDMAEKNPDKIMSMDKDVNLNMKLFIKEALKYGIWSEDKALRQFVWPDTGDPVCVVSPDSDLYQKTIEYLMASGQDTYSLVKNLVDKKKAKDKGGKKGDSTVSETVKESKKALDNSSDKKFKVPEFQEVNE